MKFIDKLTKRIEAVNSLVCVGLDSRYDRLPDFIKSKDINKSVFRFNQKIIQETNQVVAAYKMNVAFYAGFGMEGLEALRQTNNFLKQNYPDIPIIADCKRSEMGESTKMVKQEIFDWLGFDSILVTPWFGQDTIKDYLDDETKGVGVYVHDSNPSAVEFQDLELKDGRKVYEAVAENLVKNWNKNGNVFVEAGATYLLQLRKIREIVGEEIMILVAGVGVQGGKIEELKGLLGLNQQRMIVNSSRGIIFAGGKSDNEKEYLEKVSQAAENLRKSLQMISEFSPGDSGGISRSNWSGD